MTVGILTILAWLVTGWVAALTPVQSKAQLSETPACRTAGRMVRLPDVPEASGIAASRRTPGLLWMHNDSGQPVIVAVDQQGSIKGRVRVTGAEVDDWEDIAIGPCPQGSCVYIGDIGDNRGGRKTITVYRVAEPAPDEKATQPAEAFHGTYPDGPHDAEALFVTPKAEVFIVTKGDPGSIAVYRFPLRAGTVKLEQIGDPIAVKASAKERPTGADSSPDGAWVAVRTNASLAFYRMSDVMAGRWQNAIRYDLSALGEPQGEGVTFGREGTIYLAGESGGGSRGGTLARITCALPADR